MIELTAADGHIFSAYRADPSDTPKGAVVVLPEVFGIDPHIKKVTESFAALGYVALAPALFDRVKKNVELGYDEAGLTEGLELEELSRDRRRHRRYSGGRQCGQGRWKSRDRRLLLGRLPCLSLRQQGKWACLRHRLLWRGDHRCVPGEAESPNLAPFQ